MFLMKNIRTIDGRYPKSTTMKASLYNQNTHSFFKTKKNAIIEIILCPNRQNSKIICKKSRSRYRSSPTIKDKGFCDRTQWFIVINYCHKSHHTTRSRYLESVSENRTS